jgi:hypothetical protein
MYKYKYLKYKVKYLKLSGGGGESFLNELNKNFDLSIIDNFEYNHEEEFKYNLLLYTTCFKFQKTNIDIEGIIVLHFVLTNDGSGDYNWINVYLELLYKFGYKRNQIYLIIRYKDDDTQIYRSILSGHLLNNNSFEQNINTTKYMFIKTIRDILILIQREGDITIQRMITDILNFEFDRIGKINSFINLIKNFNYTLGIK